jgi:diphthamide synthase (EF-2-diphthine--ammonia ligase)
MNILNYVQQYAEQIGGEFTDYDHTKSVVVVPINGSRFQTVLAITQTSAVSGRDQALFTSKVCEYSAGLDLKNLLEQNANFDYSKFVLEEGFLKVEASCLAASVSQEQIKEMIQEVAQLADHYELKLTGKDIH